MVKEKRGTCREHAFSALVKLKSSLISLRSGLKSFCNARFTLARTGDKLGKWLFSRQQGRGAKIVSWGLGEVA